MQELSKLLSIVFPICYVYVYIHEVILVVIKYAFSHREGCLCFAETVF
jgi:hypothetical protein